MAELRTKAQMKNTYNSHSIKVISRAAGILRALSQDTGGLSLGQIAVKTELPRSTVQRLVNALTSEGFVSVVKGGGGISLGPEIHALAAASRIDMSARLRPVMEAISRETGETVDLAILDGNKMLFVDQIVGSHRLRAVSNIGETFPLTTTANGKAALACLDREAAEKLILAEFARTGRSQERVSPLLSAIEKVADGALALDNDEHTDGISALGMAVTDQTGTIFALSIPVPTSRFQRVRRQLESVLEKWRVKLAEHLPA